MAGDDALDGPASLTSVASPSSSIGKILTGSVIVPASVYSRSSSSICMAGSVALPEAVGFELEVLRPPIFCTSAPIPRPAHDCTHPRPLYRDNGLHVTPTLFLLTAIITFSDCLCVLQSPVNLVAQISR